MKEIKTDFEKQRDKNIKAIKKAIFNLRAMGDFSIEIQPTETMFGTVVNHIYLRDKIDGRLIYQKHLFTIE